MGSHEVQPELRDPNSTSAGSSTPSERGTTRVAARLAAIELEEPRDVKQLPRASFALGETTGHLGALDLRALLVVCGQLPAAMAI